MSWLLARGLQRTGKLSLSVDEKKERCHTEITEYLEYLRSMPEPAMRRSILDKDVPQPMNVRIMSAGDGRVEADRRGAFKAMVAVGISGSAALAGTEVPAASGGDAKLIHHVLFWLKNPESAEDRAALIAGLNTLRGIEIIQSLHIGVPAATEKRDVVDNSFDVSELMVFGTTSDQKSYQDHPIHKAFVLKCGHLWSKVLVYDAIAV